MIAHLLEFALLELDEDELEDDDREVDAETESDFVVSETVFEFDSASDSDFGLREAANSFLCSLQIMRGVRVGDTERLRRCMDAGSGTDAWSIDTKPGRIWPLKNSSSAVLIDRAARLNSKSACSRSTPVATEE